MKPIKCTIVDDNPLALDRLEGMLKLSGQTFIIEKWADPEEAVIHIPEDIPDLVFLDVEMPGMSGFDVINKLHQAHCFPVFIFVTGFNQYAIKAIKAEAFDYLIKPVDLDELNVCLSRLLEQKQPYYFPGFESGI